eukprot:7378612-Prymnesium_polylepis.1
MSKEHTTRIGALQKNLYAVAKHHATTTQNALLEEMRRVEDRLTKKADNRAEVLRDITLGITNDVMLLRREMETYIKGIKDNRVAMTDWVEDVAKHNDDREEHTDRRAKTLEDFLSDIASAVNRDVAATEELVTANGLTSVATQNLIQAIDRTNGYIRNQLKLIKDAVEKGDLGKWAGIKEDIVNAMNNALVIDRQGGDVRLLEAIKNFHEKIRTHRPSNPGADQEPYTPFGVDPKEGNLDEIAHNWW